MLFNKLNMFDEPECRSEDLDFEKDLGEAAHVMLKASALELEVLEETSTSTDSTRDEMPRILGRLTPKSAKGRTPRMPSKQRLREVGRDLSAKIGLESLIAWRFQMSFKLFSSYFDLVCIVFFHDFHVFFPGCSGICK